MTGRVPPGARMDLARAILLLPAALFLVAGLAVAWTIAAAVELFRNE